MIVTIENKNKKIIAVLKAVNIKDVNMQLNKLNIDTNEVNMFEQFSCIASIIIEIKDINKIYSLSELLKVEVDQNYEDETTTYHFQDGSYYSYDSDCEYTAYNKKNENVNYIEL